MKAKPRNSLRIRTANRSNPSSRCGTDAHLFLSGRHTRALVLEHPVSRELHSSEDAWSGGLIARFCFTPARTAPRIARLAPARGVAAATGGTRPPRP